MRYRLTTIPGRRGAPCNRPTALVLLIAFACSACAGETVAPRSQGEVREALREYEDQLARQGLSTEEAAARLATTSTVALDDDAAGLLDAGSRRGSFGVRAARPAQQPARSWKEVDGVAEYRIGRGDLLQVTAYVGSDTAVLRLRVQSDGTVFIPRFGIGAVEARTLSPTELAEALAARYRAFAPEAHVEVEVAEHRAWPATLMGEIRVRAQEDTGAGEYPLEGRTTLAEFIFEHGGVTEEADLSDVRVRRDGEEFRLDLADLDAFTREGRDFVVDAGDVVFVPPREIGASRYHVLGEVNSPGVFTFTEGATVLDAISRAGSFTQDAELGDAFVSRPSEGRPRVIPVDLEALMDRGELDANVMLQPGDFVVVPRQAPPFLQRVQTVLGIVQIAIGIAILATVNSE